MGDQKSSDLCGGRLLIEHESHGISRFFPAHSLAGVFAATNLA